MGSLVEKILKDPIGIFSMNSPKDIGYEEPSREEGSYKDTKRILKGSSFNPLGEPLRFYVQ